MAEWSRQTWRTPAYFILDPETEKFEAFALDVSQRAYVPLEPNPDGDFAVAPLGLSIGLRPTRYRHYERAFVRWIDAGGKPLPTGQERAELERERADREHARVKELEEGLRALEAKTAGRDS